MSAAAILLHPDDNILVLRRDIGVGERIEVGNREHIVAGQAIELGHKIARFAITLGDPVVKYGVVIGTTTSAIPSGGWVHVHNLKSNYIAAHIRAPHSQEDDR